MAKESFPSKTKEKFHFKEIEQLRTPVERVMKKLYPKIAAGEYGLILGDDASGRIPSLLLNDIIRGIYQEFGHEYPRLSFVAGSKELEGEAKDKKKEKISRFLEELQKKQKNGERKILIVTDVIATGVSLDPLIEAIKEKGIDFDVVSMGDVSSYDIDSRWGKPIYSGETGVPKIYGMGSLSGVEKNVNELFSHRIKDNDAYTDDEKIDMQMNVNEAREDTSRLAGEILEKIRKEKKIK